MLILGVSDPAQLRDIFGNVVHLGPRRYPMMIVYRPARDSEGLAA